jgi:glycosyltransferase involved in cell wall biosynthesis
MKVALIATLFNESDNVVGWWDCLMRQTVLPDEIAIVDGGSKDGTFEKLRELAARSPVPVKLEQRRCNIAGGRNRAIELTDAEIIAATDAGCLADKNWFAEITRPLVEDAGVDFVSGKIMPSGKNEFQKFIERFDGLPDDPKPGEAHGSGRNTAYRRTAWADVGGYPEWLTLTAEDYLFNLQLQRVGKRFFYNPAAVVGWPMRDNPESYYKMLYWYGFGAGEARLAAPYFLRRTAVMLCPLILLGSRHRFSFLKYRYRKNAASASGWLAGWIKGNRPPAGWERIDGIYLSPESQKCLARSSK